MSGPGYVLAPKRTGRASLVRFRDSPLVRQDVA